MNILFQANQSTKLFIDIMIKSLAVLLLAAASTTVLADAGAADGGFQYTTNPDYTYSPPGSNPIAKYMGIPMDWYTRCNSTIASICQNHLGTSSNPSPAQQHLPPTGPYYDTITLTTSTWPSQITDGQITPVQTPVVMPPANNKWIWQQGDQYCMIGYFIPSGAAIPSQDDCTTLLQQMISGVGPNMSRTPTINRASLNINTGIANGLGFPTSNNQTGVSYVSNEISWIAQP